MNVGQHTTGGDGHAVEQLVELLVVVDGQLHVAGGDALALVVAGDVTGQLDHLSGQVLHDAGEVHRGIAADSGGITALAQVPSDAADGKLEAGVRAAGLGHVAVVLPTSTLTFARHQTIDVRR